MKNMWVNKKCFINMYSFQGKSNVSDHNDNVIFRGGNSFMPIIPYIDNNNKNM